jgi:UDP-N-acetyl-D-galactosamine dehydrogenase
VDINSEIIGVIGLGYVGLPLALAFSAHQKVIGFDIDDERIIDLKNGIDKTNESDPSEIKSASYLTFTSNINDLKQCRIFIVTVPTPIDEHKNPDLSFLVDASEKIGKILRKDSLVIYESTVYPGCTEEECIPLLERNSGLRLNLDFFVGYSPERINPGDKGKRLKDIKKIISGSNEYSKNIVNYLYTKIITAGTYQASSIKVAEAAKAIENTQRDINIALMNELSIIFEKLNINTKEVLEAASSKWNFISYKPGLVGGHCIGVDPYYLTYKSESVGYKPEIILSGRRVNDGMAPYSAQLLLKNMAKKNINIIGSKILILGYAFKENCPDTRNTKVYDMVSELKEYKCEVDIYDPLININDRQKLNFVTSLYCDTYDGIILAVPHNEIIKIGLNEIRRLGKKRHVLFDLKQCFDKSEVDIQL